jgi:hypothetical protein
MRDSPAGGDVVLLNLEQPEHAYLLGFLLGDGHLYAGPGRKGRLTVELAAVDGDHLIALAALLPGSRLSTRQRRTNFAEHHRSAILSCCALDVREALREAGMPVGRKDSRIAPPQIPYSERDFARGLVDADGSLGLTGRGFPFVSLVTTSPALSLWWCDLLLRVSEARRTARPNRRDGAMNIMVAAEPAVRLVRWLYQPDDLALPRKVTAAAAVREWTRPPDMRA